MATIPQTMRSLVAPKACKPAGYEIRQVPVPTLTRPGDVLLRIHAVGMNTFDPQIMSGQMSLVFKPQYPAGLGAEGSGVVVAVGSAVTSLRVGDEVYGFNVDKPFNLDGAGWASDYAIAQARFLVHKPPHVSFEAAASFTGFTVTAMQAIRRGLRLGGLDEETGLEGKTVFVPAALSGLGSVTIQVAKNVFGAKRIISTVSTPKMGLVEDYLPGLVDQVIDYKTQNIAQVVGKGTVDFAVSTQRTTLDDCIGVVDPHHGIIISLADAPSKETARELLPVGKYNVLVGLVLDLLQLYYQYWKLGGTSIKYEMVSGGPHIREDLEKAGEVVALEKVKAVMRVYDFDDLEGVKKACEVLRVGKGGIGKLVIKLV